MMWHGRIEIIIGGRNSWCALTIGLERLFFADSFMTSIVPVDAVVNLGWNAGVLLAVAAEQSRMENVMAMIHAVIY